MLSYAIYAVAFILYYDMDNMVEFLRMHLFIFLYDMQLSFSLASTLPFLMFHFP